MSQIQSILFNKNIYDEQSANKWLKKLEITPMKKVHVTEKYLRYRLNDPLKYSKMRTKKITPGISLIMGFPKKKGGLILDIFSRPPPSAIEEFIKNNANTKITNLRVCRKPISGIYQSILNIVSLGKWNSIKNRLKYDDVFHLWLEIDLGNETYITEKNHRITLFKKTADLKPSACKIVNNVNITVSEFWKNAVTKINEDALFVYDPVYQNCQQYVYDLLNSNGLMTDELKKFIKQDIDKLIPKFTHRITKGVTDIAARIDRLIRGKGRKKKYGQKL